MSFGYLSFEAFFPKSKNLTEAVRDLMQLLPFKRVFLDSFWRGYETRQLAPADVKNEVRQSLPKQNSSGSSELRAYTTILPLLEMANDSANYGQTISYFSAREQNIVRWRTIVGYFRTNDFPKVIRNVISLNYEKFVKDYVKKTEPEYARGRYDDSVFFEYFNDPYRFCTPVRTQYCGEFFDFQQVALLNDKNSLYELAQAKRILPEKYLVAKIKKSIPDALETNRGGIGVWRSRPSQSASDTEENSDHELYPTYFLRQELRERGANLYFGPTEKHFATYAMGLPDYYAKTGLISKEIAEKLKKRGGYGEMAGYAQRMLEILSTEEKSMLGLDGPLAPGMKLAVGSENNAERKEPHGTGRGLKNGFLSAIGNLGRHLKGSQA